MIMWWCRPDGELKLVGPQGEVSFAQLRQGKSYFRNAGVEHDVINNGPGEMIFIEIELEERPSARRCERPCERPGERRRDRPAAVGAPLDYLMLVAAAVIYGAMFSVNKMAATGGAPPLAYAFWQSFGAGVVLWIVLTLRGERLGVSRQALTSYIVIGALVSGLPISLLTYIAPKLPAGVMTLVLALSPPFTFAIGVLARVDAFAGWGLFGLLFGFAGVVLIVAPGASLGGAGPGSGSARTVGASHVRGIERFRCCFTSAASSSVATGAGVMLGSAAVLLPIMLLAGQAWFPKELDDGAIATLIAIAINAVFLVLSWKSSGAPGRSFLRNSTTLPCSPAWPGARSYSVSGCRSLWLPPWR